MTTRRIEKAKGHWRACYRTPCRGVVPPFCSWPLIGQEINGTETCGRWGSDWVLPWWPEHFIVRILFFCPMYITGTPSVWLLLPLSWNCYGQLHYTEHYYNNHNCGESVASFSLILLMFKTYSSDTAINIQTHTHTHTHTRTHAHTLIVMYKH